MRSTDEIRWLKRTLALCARSATAYKAAFLLADCQVDECESLHRCTCRYALLEELLAELGGLVGSAAARGRIERLSADPSGYPNRNAALAAATISDRDLRHALVGRSARSGRSLTEQQIVAAASVRTPVADCAKPLPAACAPA
jgi:hypothetical protein